MSVKLQSCTLESFVLLFLYFGVKNGQRDEKMSPEPESKVVSSKWVKCHFWANCPFHTLNRPTANFKRLRPDRKIVILTLDELCSLFRTASLSSSGSHSVTQLSFGKSKRKRWYCWRTLQQSTPSLSGCSFTARERCITHRRVG